jgi:AcrR family transcriptional regulator
MDEGKVSRLQRASSSRDALMRSALQMIERDGVLAGLNVSEVAKEVGVTPANVYHFFGSRQGLLRKAIVRALDEIRSLIYSDTRWPERPKRMFQIISQHPQAPLWALLAMDGDPDFKPSPFHERAKRELEKDVEEGVLPESGLDLEMLNHLMLMGSVGYAIFRKSTAAQLDCSVEELDRRAERVFGQIADLAVPEMDVEEQERAASEG